MPTNYYGSIYPTKEAVIEAAPGSSRVSTTNPGTKRVCNAPMSRIAPYEIMDIVVPGFGVRVMGKPEAPVRSFVLLKRFPGSHNPTRRTLGSYGEITLAEAREKARSWLGMIARGIDPATERKAELEAEKRRQTCTFESALEDYLQRKASKLRSGSTIAQVMRREFLGWMDRPLSDIDQREVKDAIQRIIDRGAETQAHAIFAMLRGFFNWCVDSGDFGIETSLLLTQETLASQTEGLR